MLRIIFFPHLVDEGVDLDLLLLPEVEENRPSYPHPVNIFHTINERLSALSPQAHAQVEMTPFPFLPTVHPNATCQWRLEWWLV